MSCNHPAPDPNNLQSPLLRLPRELRDEIWAYLVMLPNVIHLVEVPHFEARYDQAGKKVYIASQRLSHVKKTLSKEDFDGFSILRVCRQINAEAYEVLLSRNLWSGHGYGPFDTFARILCPCKVANIRRMELRDSMSSEIAPWLEVSRAIRRFSGLRLVVAFMVAFADTSHASGTKSADIHASYLALQMKKHWTGYADAMNGSALRKVYMPSQLSRLPLKNGTKGPISSTFLDDEPAVLFYTRGLREDELIWDKLDYKVRELDIEKEIRYWQNWEWIDEKAYNEEVEWTIEYIQELELELELERRREQELELPEEEEEE